MTKKTFLTMTLLGSVAASLLLTNSVFAVPCGYGGVTVSTACRDGLSEDNNDSAADLNAGAFFGINTWEEVAKVEDLNQGLFDLNVGSIGESSGTWSFDPIVWTKYSSIAIVLKDGQYIPSGADQIWWSAYLLAPNTSNGTWEFGWNKELSHLAVYGDPTPVPEPATMMLFGTGLAGLAGMVRRKSRKTEK